MLSPDSSFNLSEAFRLVLHYSEKADKLTSYQKNLIPDTLKNRFSIPDTLKE